eukprot:CAMPEP_0169159124 /NCGR_PEP_ID=MMETSP1015-20121227/55590_1 /TAXON_ID=342587 /ORGANISM="Karlodinium micrum, Strain CCMP2283" /LENGTH=144 /DNA_ID=CAMNT_0009230385 /DNA_START=52 /DNA_END=483 /DNA_ORIENTATION=-
MGCAASGPIAEPFERKKTCMPPIKTLLVEDFGKCSSVNSSSARFDPQMGCFMTYTETRSALSQAQMTEAQIWAYWCKLPSSPECSSPLGHDSPMRLASRVRLRVVMITGDSCFDGEVPADWNVTQLKAKLARGQGEPLENMRLW